MLYSKKAWEKSCVSRGGLVRLCLQVTKHIRVRAGGSGAGSAQDLSTFTPTFLWLLRDFYLGTALAALASVRFNTSDLSVM